MILTITLTIAAALALLNVGLAIRIVRLRLGGHGAGHELLDVRMRTQANLVEYAPFFLILLALIELAGASPFWLWIAGALFVLVRLSHAFGMERPSPNPFRASGAVATWVLLLLMSGWALATAYAARPDGGAVIVEPASVRA